MLSDVEGSIASGVPPSERLYCQVKFAQELSAQMEKRNLKHGVRYKVRILLYSLRFVLSFGAWVVSK